MRTRPDIQQRAALARLSVLYQQKVARTKAQQVVSQRAHNTVEYRRNLLLNQMMANFDRWAKDFLGLWR
jgi:hypothetical protein